MFKELKSAPTDILPFFGLISHFLFKLYSCALENDPDMSRSIYPNGCVTLDVLQHLQPRYLDQQLEIIQKQQPIASQVVNLFLCVP